MSCVDLNEKTVAELRAMCVKAGIVGMSHARKDELIDILDDCCRDEVETNNQTVIGSDAPIVSINSEVNSYVDTTKGEGSEDKYITSITVSCGASSGNFPVVGKSIGQVSTFLREALNIDRLSVGVVNGEECEDNYILKSNDSLEFLKAGGHKG
jgi:hypothetical protein